MRRMPLRPRIPEQAVRINESWKPSGAGRAWRSPESWLNMQARAELLRASLPSPGCLITGLSRLRLPALERSHNGRTTSLPSIMISPRKTKPWWIGSWSRVTPPHRDTMIRYTLSKDALRLLQPRIEPKPGLDGKLGCQRRLLLDRGSSAKFADQHHDKAIAICLYLLSPDFCILHSPPWPSPARPLLSILPKNY